MRSILRRLIVAIPVLFGATVADFALLYAAPGSPVNALVNPLAGEKVRQAVKEDLGLNRPLVVQYWNWLEQAIHGNLGYSYVTYEPVIDVMAASAVPTVILALAAMVLTYAIGVPLGIVSALRPYSKTDLSITMTTMLGISVPSFILALLAIYVFALVLPVVPSGGMAGAGQGFSIPVVLHHLVLPALVLATFETAMIVRFTRSSMLEVTHEEYLRTAIAKGLPRRRVIWRHGFRNALGPLITQFGLLLPRLLGGAVVVEVVFQWPGIGNLLLHSVNSRDYPVLLAVNLLIAVLVIVGNLIADIMYTVADPRVRA